MKAFAASIVLFFTVIALTVINAVYISSITDQMKSLSQAVCEASDTEKAISELSEYWETHEKYVSLSAGLRDLDKVTEEILKLRAACQSDNEHGKLQSCRLLIDALDDIKKHERFSMDSIF